MTATPAPAAERVRAGGIDWTAVAIAAVGALLAVVFAVATLRIPLNRYFPDAGVSVSFVEMLGPGWETATLQYVDVALLTFALYFVALAVVWRTRRRIHPLLLFGMPALFALILLSMYPPTAIDLFHYQASTRLLWVHGENPLTVAPGDFPYPIGYSWAGLPAPYGPFWSILAGPAAWLPGDNYILGLYEFKLIAAASYLGCAVMIWRIVRRTRPGQEALAVVLFAWNPFVLFRVVGDGHNDLVMMLFLLVAFELAHRGRWNWAFQALALSALVKYVSLLIGPPLLLYLLFHTEGDARARLKTAAQALSLATLTVVVMFAPFWEGLATLDTLRQVDQMLITSTPLLIGLLISGPPGDPETAESVRTVLRVVFAGLLLALTWQARRSFDDLVVASFTILFLYLLLPTGWYRPWYMLWPLTIAALRPRSWLAPCLLAISFFGAFPDLIEHYRQHWTFLRDYTKAVAAPIVVAFVPPALVWLAGVVRFRGWMLDGVERAEERAPEPVT